VGGFRQHGAGPADDPGSQFRHAAYNELYPYQAGVYEYDSGALMGWAWGISRIIDAIKNDAEGANQYNLAWNQTAVTGVSRNGKAAALAAAIDSRVAIAAPSDPGSGLTGFRNLTEGEMFTYNVPAGTDQIYSLNETLQRAIGNQSETAWFTSVAQQFYPDNPYHSPFDMHALPALVAPRPFILWSGEAQQAWLGYYLPWSRPGKYALWSEDTYVTAGMPRVLTFHTDAGQVCLTLPDGSRLVRSAPGGTATFRLTAAQAQPTAPRPGSPTRTPFTGM